ncbi:MAG: ATP-binding protein [Flavobacteriales bacterium]
MIQRSLFSELSNRLFRGKAIVLLGPRQVGKTTLIRSLLDGQEFLFLDGDDPDVRGQLEGAGVSRLQAIIGRHKVVFMDEAQRIPDVGLVAKMITDRFSEVQLLISGSSALDISNAMQEPLTGRKFEYHLFAISWEEFEKHVGYMEAQSQLEERLIFGMYPDVVNHREDAREILKQLTMSYLYKDVLALSGIKKPELLDKLVKALALQLGSEVSYNELSNLLEIDKATVARYIDLLEKSFIVFRLNSYSGNQRNEIKNGRKIYFYDNGIRNMVINNLNQLDLRNDKGALWENFLVSERIKLQAFHQLHINNYFWRTVQKQEIDFIEEANGTLTAYEFKWKSAKAKKLPSPFTEHYQVTGKLIDSGNFREFVMRD